MKVNVTNRATALLALAASIDPSRELPTKGAARIELTPTVPIHHGAHACRFVADIDLHADHVVIRVEAGGNVVAMLDWRGRALGWSHVRGAAESTDVARYLTHLQAEIESRVP